MHDLILHQYEMSPFSEKVRRILACKGLPFRSVRAPAVMPKPDLVALTGGYRKIPVLQVGNDVYCDTALIARVIEGAARSPTLYPTPLSELLAGWADTALFDCAVAIGMRPTRFDDVTRWLLPDELARMGEDRAAMHGDSRRKFPPAAAAKAHLQIYLAALDDQLSRQAFLFGDVPSIADFAVYHPLWFLEKLAPEPLTPFDNLRAFRRRVDAFELRQGDTLTGEEALAVARASAPERPEQPDFDGGAGFARGQAVVVRALDNGRDPVFGDLVHLAVNEIAVRRHDERAGTVFVHFPRVGFELRSA
jgi:glutathione S-transferase